LTPHKMRNIKYIFSPRKGRFFISSDADGYITCLTCGAESTELSYRVRGYLSSVATKTTVSALTPFGVTGEVKGFCAVCRASAEPFRLLDKNGNKVVKYVYGCMGSYKVCNPDGTGNIGIGFVGICFGLRVPETDQKQRVLEIMEEIKNES